MSSEQRDAKCAYKSAYRNANKDAIQAYDAAYYAAHKDEKRAYMAAYSADHRDAIIAKRRQKQAEFTEWLQILRDVTGCEDEGPHEGRLLHHHVDPSTKRFGLSNMFNCSLDVLEEELEKCVVHCHSCHTKRHVEMRAL